MQKIADGEGEGGRCQYLSATFRRAVAGVGMPQLVGIEPGSTATTNHKGSEILRALFMQISRVAWVSEVPYCGWHAARTPRISHFLSQIRSAKVAKQFPNSTPWFVP